MDERRWVIVTTGSTQSFIFAMTTKQAVNLAASRAVRDVCTAWTREAVEKVVGPGGLERAIATLTSGRAHLILTQEQGLRVIADVTERVAMTYPTLEVWGTIGEAIPGSNQDIVDPAIRQAVTDIGASQSLQASLRAHERHRHSVVGAHTRDVMEPFTQRCAYTAMPATTVAPEERRTATAPPVPRSRIVDVLWREARDARQELGSRLRAASDDLLQDGEVQKAVVSVDRLARGEGVRHDGWVAAVHLDGNGFSQIFRDVTDTYIGEPEHIHRFGAALDTAMWRAIATAIASVGVSAEVDPGWVLPIVVGGDDVSLVVDAKHATELVHHLVTSFERLVRADDAISAARDAAGFAWPSISAGIAFVKPHHPFHHAHELAVEACGEVKHALAATYGPGEQKPSAWTFVKVQDGSLNSHARLRFGTLLYDDGGHRDWAWPGAITVAFESEDFATTPQITRWVDAYRAGDDPESTAVEHLSSRFAHEVRRLIYSGGRAPEIVRELREHVPEPLHDLLDTATVKRRTDTFWLAWPAYELFDVMRGTGR